MSDFSSLISANGARWERAKLTRNDFRNVAARLCSHKTTYEQIEANTGVPWSIVSVIHEREASGDFSKSIAQGDPWDQKSTHIPKQRGPFDSFETAAYDALVNCPPNAAQWKDWSAGGSLTLLERYNGLGYTNRGLPSPYIWSGTDQYKKGKFTSDGKFDPEAVDKQLGCAGLLMSMRQIDSSIRFANESKPSVKPDIKTAGPIATGTAAGGAAHAAGLPVTLCIAIALGAAFAIIAFIIIKNRK